MFCETCGVQTDTAFHCEGYQRCFCGYCGGKLPEQDSESTGYQPHCDAENEAWSEQMEWEAQAEYQAEQAYERHLEDQGWAEQSAFQAWEDSQGLLSYEEARDQWEQRQAEGR